MGCQVLRDHEQVSKGQALINFAYPEHVAAAISNFNNKPFPGREGGNQLMSVTNYIMNHPQRLGAQSIGPKNNLYVTGLKPSTSEEEVRVMFSEFGTVKSILIKTPMAATSQAAPLLSTHASAYVQLETE